MRLQLTMHGRQRRGQTSIVFVGWVGAAVFDDWTLTNHVHWRAVLCHFENVLLSLLRTLLYKMMCAAFFYERLLRCWLIHLVPVKIFYDAIVLASSMTTTQKMLLVEA